MCHSCNSQGIVFIAMPTINNFQNHLTYLEVAHPQICNEYESEKWKTMCFNSFTMLIILFCSNLCVCLLHVSQFKTFDSLCNCLFTLGRHRPWAVGLLLAKPTIINLTF